MKQLTGMDVGFLVMETPNTYGHVSGLSVYQRPSPDFRPLEVVRQRFNTLVGNFEPFRRKLVEVPFGLDRPYWIDDADFDLDFHVRHIGLAPPGAADQLAEQVARIVGRKMDRSRPLWEAYVIEGLADGRWAMLQKTHHATIDGAAGVIAMMMFTDDGPDGEWHLTEQPWEGEQPPDQSEVLGKAISNLAMNPVRGTRFGLKVVRDLAETAGVSTVSGAAQKVRSALASVGKPPSGGSSGINVPITPAPPTPWNKSVGPHRRFAMRSAPLANLKALKDATGGTINDIVMAVCTGALRHYLLDHDALPAASLRAMVPVSIRTFAEEDPWTNRVSAIVADLPTEVEDPLERVERCRDAMQTAKNTFDLVPAETLGQVADYASPIVSTSALRMVHRLKLADRVNTPVNVVISNVPGPREPLYFAGAKLDAYIPVSTITDNIGLNITVHSYDDRLDFGLIADRDLVADLWHLVDLHIAEIDRLFEASGATYAVEPPPPPMRFGGDGVAPVPPSSAAVGEMITARAAIDAALLGSDPGNAPGTAVTAPEPKKAAEKKPKKAKKGKP
ncbi:MAG: wax ester/triacylglycerol synthase family O-acyltransferase [Actinomycetota bacterium]